MNIDELLTEEEKKAIECWKEAQKYARVAEKEVVFNEDYEKAAEYLTKAIELDPENFLYYEERADCYRELNKNDKELIDINKAIELNPDEDRLYLDRSYYYSRIGEYDKALEEINKAIEILYNKISFYCGVIMSQIYKEMRDYERAIEFCDKGLKISNFHYETIRAYKKTIQEELNKAKEK